MNLVSTLALRLLVLALAATATVGQVAYLDAVYWHVLGWAPPIAGSVPLRTLAVVGADAAVSILAALVAVSLAFRKADDRGARPLAVAVGAWAYLLAYGGVFRLLGSATTGALRVGFQSHFLIVECLGLAGLLAFSSAFPARLTRERLGPMSELPKGLGPVRSLRIWLLRPEAPWLGALALMTLVLLLARTQQKPLADAPLSPVMDVARFATLAVVVINFRSSWDAGGAAQRARLNWMVVGLTLLTASLALIIGGNVLTSVTAWRPALNWRPILLNLGLLGILWGSAMAVFYEGPLDAKALAHGFATWTGLATALLFLAAGLEALFSDTMVTRLSMPAGVGTVAAICLFAWIFDAARRLVGVMVTQIWDASLPEGEEPEAT